MISFFDNIKSTHCMQLDAEGLTAVLDSAELKRKAERIVSLLAEGKDSEASAVKASLPVVVLGQLYDEGSPRRKNGGKPTGLLMIDYDNCNTTDDAKQLMHSIKFKYLSDQKLQDIIVAAHYSPRMHGVHIWYRWIDGCHSYAECNERIAQMLSQPDYDESCKDNSRCSFLVPHEYFEIENFGAIDSNEAFAKMQEEQETPSLPPRGEGAKVTMSSAANSACQAGDLPTPLGGESGRSSYPSEYEGISYDVLISALTAECAPKSKIDSEGNVLEGARDNTFFKMACLLRYICDNNAEWIEALAPEWAHRLDDEQPGRLRELCRNACKRNLAFSFPPSLQKVLDSLTHASDSENAAEGAREAEEAHQRACIEKLDELAEERARFLRFPEKLPPIFQECCDAVKPEWKPAVVLTLLPAVGTICSKLRSKYLDSRMHSPSFQTVIEAPMGAGKQNMTDYTDMILEPLTRLDEIGNNQINMYNAELVKANNAKSLSDKPNPIVRGMIGRFTEAGLNDVLDTSHGLHIWSGVSEIDQVVGVWRDLSYILRLAYDNAMYARTIQSPRQHRGGRRLYMNTFLCGTPAAVNRMYTDPEDGLVSRTMFFKLMYETPDMPVNNVSPPQLKKIRTICQRLHQQYCVGENGEVASEQTVNLQYVNNHLEQWLQRKHIDATTYGSEALERFRRRDGLNGFRAAMVATAIYSVSRKKITEADKEVITGFAEWVADYSLMMHDYKFGKDFNAILEQSQATDIQKKTPVLDRLPGTFTLAEAYRAFSGHKEVTVRKLLSRLVSDKLLVNVERGVYSKVKVA